MKKIFIIIALSLSVIVNNSCNDASKSENKESILLNDLAVQFDAEDLYRELVRRSYHQTHLVTQRMSDSIPTIFTDSLEDIRDTIIKPSLNDTVQLANVKSELSKFSNDDLFKAYNKIINSREVNKGIFGIDNRTDLTPNLEQNYLSSSQTVFALVERRLLVLNNGDRNYSLRSKGIYSSLYNLCESETTFAKQNLYADCSAFAISTNKVVTAGHCINRANFRSYVLIADLTLTSMEHFLTTGGIPSENVFEITEIVDRRYTTEIDYAVLSVNKPIPSNRIAKLGNNDLNDNSSFYVLGFPCGLPMKLCNKATLRFATPNYFVINSDTYGGNSGYPVYNESTNEVEGILVRDNQDFSMELDNCRKSIRCPEFGCRGEEVTKINFIKKYSK